MQQHIKNKELKLDRLLCYGVCTATYFFFIILNIFKVIQPRAPPIAPEIAHTKTPVIPKYSSAIFLRIINPTTANETNYLFRI